MEAVPRPTQYCNVLEYYDNILQYIIYIYIHIIYIYIYLYIYTSYIYIHHIYYIYTSYMMNPLGGLCTSTRHAEFRLTVERSKLGTASSGRCALSCGAWKP